MESTIKKMKFKITYLIDVVSKRPEDYTRYSEVDAVSKYEAIIKYAREGVIESHRDRIETELRKCKNEEELIKTHSMSTRGGNITNIEEI